VINVELIYSGFDSSLISFSRSFFLLLATVSHLSSSQAGLLLPIMRMPEPMQQQWLSSQDSSRQAQGHSGPGNAKANANPSKSILKLLAKVLSIPFAIIIVLHSALNLTSSLLQKEAQKSYHSSQSSASTTHSPLQHHWAPSSPHLQLPPLHHFHNPLPHWC
jgi:hypothetical protein